MRNIALLLAVFFLGSSGFAKTDISYQNNCTLARAGQGSIAVVIDGKILEYYGNVSSALNEFQMLSAVGVCSKVKKSNCTLARAGQGSITVVIDGKILEYYENVSSALDSISSLKKNQICD